MSLRIATLEYPPQTGGIARLVGEIASQLETRGELAELIAPSPSGEAVIQYPSPHKLITGQRLVRERRFWKALLTNQRTTLVSSWYPDGLLATLVPNSDVIMLAHGAELRKGSSRIPDPIRDRLLRRTLSTARLVVANSHYTAELVRVCAPDANVVAIPLAVDHERFRPADSSQVASSRSTIRILTVARVESYKGHDTVFRAIAALPAGLRNRVRYMIAGTGPAEAGLKALADKLGIAGAVEWLGFVPEADLPGVYQKADIFALCTRDAADSGQVEGFGLAFLEAQASGVPAIGTNTGGIADAVAHEDGGWLIEPDDSDGLRDLIIDLADQPNQFREAGRQARTRVERTATWDRYTSRLLKEIANA